MDYEPFENAECIADNDMMLKNAEEHIKKLTLELKEL